jgi:hypothetical protein
MAMDDRWVEEAGLDRKISDDVWMNDDTWLDRDWSEGKSLDAAVEVPERLTHPDAGLASCFVKYPAFLVLPVLVTGLIAFLLILAMIGG